LTIIYNILSLSPLAGGQSSHEITNERYSTALEKIKKTEEFTNGNQLAIFNNNSDPKIQDLLYYSTQVVNGVNHIMIFSTNFDGEKKYQCIRIYEQLEVYGGKTMLNHSSLNLNRLGACRACDVASYELEKCNGENFPH